VLFESRFFIIAVYLFSRIADEKLQGGGGSAARNYAVPSVQPLHGGEAVRLLDGERINWYMLSLETEAMPKLLETEDAG
jgi:hypothetical protein